MGWDLKNTSGIKFEKREIYKKPPILSTTDITLQEPKCDLQTTVEIALAN